MIESHPYLEIYQVRKWDLHNFDYGWTMYVCEGEHDSGPPPTMLARLGMNEFVYNDMDDVTCVTLMRHQV